MPASAARAALVSSQYRWDIRIVAGVLTAHPRAREEAADSYCSTADGAAAINSDILNLLSAEAQLMEIEVNPLPPLNFRQLCPTARLEYAPLGISRDVLIVGFSSEIRADGTERGSLLVY